MKKLMLSLAVACVSAATAFADGPTWFANAVDKQQIVGSWTINDTAASLDTLMGANAFITYKDMENDLVFTANTAQTLPGDEATVNTTVKFTAMAMEDFIDLTNVNKTAWADAKGGLTIIEDPENTYKFYGIVDGTWQELADGTVTAASVISGNEAVSVEVKIWENNGRKISYKVNDAFIGNSSTGLAASGSGATISAIAYRGNCEISSLTGDRADEMWEITLNGLLEAVATLKVGTETYEVPDTGKVSIQATKTDDISVVYAPAPGYMFFPTSGKGVDSVESTKTTVTGSQEISAGVEGYTYAEIVAKVDDTDCYDTLAKAIAAGADKTVKVVSAPEATAQTIHATMNLDATGFTVAGNITINKAAALTILGGNFSGTLTGALLISGASTFAQVDKDTASGLCTTGWFAEAVGNGSQVVAGAAPVTVADGISISYDENEVSEDDLKTPATETGNGQPGWVNYAMGLDAVTTVNPNIVKEDVSATALKLAPSTKGRPGTGFVITMTKNDTAFDGNLTLAAGTYVIKTVLSDGKGKTVDVVTKTVGVTQPTVSDAEKSDIKLVTVPYKQIDGSAMTIDEVINKASLYVDDELSIYNGDDYDHYKLSSDGVWAMADKAGVDANSIPTVKPGQGIWLKTAASNFFQYGLVEAAAPVAVSTGWNLLGVKEANLAVTAITGAEAGDVIRVENVTTKLPIEYTYDGTDWKYQTTEIVEQKAKNGRTIKLKQTTSHTVEGTIPVNGNGVWYVSQSGAATIEL